MACREKQRLAREATARVQALKAHNYEEYLRLARTAKDDRLRQLLNKTDEIMMQLGRNVRRGGEGSEGMGCSGVDGKAVEGWKPWKPGIGMEQRAKQMGAGELVWCVVGKYLL